MKELGKCILIEQLVCVGRYTIPMQRGREVGEKIFGKIYQLAREIKPIINNVGNRKNPSYSGQSIQVKLGGSSFSFLMGSLSCHKILTRLSIDILNKNRWRSKTNCALK